MKIKPLYLYSIVSFIAAVLIAYVLLLDNPGKVTPANQSIADQQMPNDSIHSGLQNPNAQSPSKNNVMENIKHAIAMMKKSVEENPKDTLRIKQYADILTQSHQPKEAIGYYKQILKLNPKRVDVLFGLSYAYYLDKQFDNAENTLNKILKYDKKNLEAYFNLGVVAQGKGEKQKAKDIWTKLMKEYPNSKVAKVAKASLERL